jgi:hypothetical protein
MINFIIERYNEEHAADILTEVHVDILDTAGQKYGMTLEYEEEDIGYEKITLDDSESRDFLVEVDNVPVDFVPAGINVRLKFREPQEGFFKKRKFHEIECHADIQN